MRAILWLIAGISLVLVLGCRDKKEPATNEEYGKTVQEGEIREGEPGIEQPPVDITAERKTFLSEMEQRMNALDREIQELQSTAGERAEDLKQRLVQERQDLNQAMAEARQATADNWAQAKQKASRAIDKMQRAYEQAVTELESEGESTPPKE